MSAKRIKLDPDETIKTSFKARIAFLMDLCGAPTRKAFCEIVDVKFNTLKRAIERSGIGSTKLHVDNVHKICAHFHPCSSHWLTDGTGDPPNQYSRLPLMETKKETGDDEHAFGLFSEEEITGEPTQMDLQSMVFIPKLRPDFFLKGEAALLTVGTTEWFGFPRAVLEPLVSSISAVRVLAIQDDFMYDLLRKDDLALVDTGKKDITNGKIYAFVAGTALFVSELSLSPRKNRIILYPKNPDYSTMDIDLQAVRIIGELFWFGRVMA